MKTNRLQSIDALRGLVMIVMALDHIRDFFHFDAALHDPTNLADTSPILFLTRWITHFCAPTFIFLTGLSAYLYGLKHTKNELSRFLFTRGLWLIFLEVTVVAFGWFFTIRVHDPILMVIWAIGISMVFLSLMVRFPYMVTLVTGLLIVFLHNLTDSVHFTPGTFMGTVWTLLHNQGRIVVSEHLAIFCFYPVLPYFGLICVGYAFGKLFSPDTASATRKKLLIGTGLSCIGLFVLLRSTNIYGNPFPWAHQNTLVNSILSFLDCNKYPVSLLFALMTLGPSILFLALTEGVQNRFTAILATIGKVPMFYYLMHIYLIHTIAILTEDANPTSFMHVTQRFHLWTVYLIWFGVVLALYFPCKWYGNYKSAHPEKKWLSYL
ncbi:MAG TPA: heparan-alpha-glucosaminide N-acetyltransferase domain-containing protein [Bacteroidia bacterium]|jgi:uncharacterized membrane protein|nr:heparan-alpha-glucosaminide N-acetyltransferase domain-containing protein [Bacteroidia bacterium]